MPATNDSAPPYARAGRAVWTAGLGDFCLAPVPDGDGALRTASALAAAKFHTAVLTQARHGGYYCVHAALSLNMPN